MRDTLCSTFLGVYSQVGELDAHELRTQSTIGSDKTCREGKAEGTQDHKTGPSKWSRRMVSRGAFELRSEEMELS